MQEISRKDFVPPRRIERLSMEPESIVLSVKLRGRICNALDMPGKSMHKGIKFLSLPQY